MPSSALRQRRGKTSSLSRRLWAGLLAATLLGGTAAGAGLRGHPYVAGAIISLLWLAATWHGFRLMRRTSDV